MSVSVEGRREVVSFIEQIGSHDSSREVLGTDDLAVARAGRERLLLHDLTVSFPFVQVAVRLAPKLGVSEAHVGGINPCIKHADYHALPCILRPVQ